MVDLGARLVLPCLIKKKIREAAEIEERDRTLAAPLIGTALTHTRDACIHAQRPVTCSARGAGATCDWLSW